MTFDRFDIASAWYLWLTLNHGGQWSPEYARLCRLQRYYRPGMMGPSYENLSDNGKAIYDNIPTKAN